MSSSLSVYFIKAVEVSIHQFPTVQYQYSNNEANTNIPIFQYNYSNNEADELICDILI